MVLELFACSTISRIFNYTMGAFPHSTKETQRWAFHIKMIYVYGQFHNEYSIRFNDNKRRVGVGQKTEQAKTGETPISVFLVFASHHRNDAWLLDIFQV